MRFNVVLSTSSSEVRFFSHSSTVMCGFLLFCSYLVQDWSFWLTCWFGVFGMLVVRDSTIPPSFTSRPEPPPIPALTTSEPSVAGMIVPESWFVKRRSACSHQRSTMWSPANVKVCCITGSWILAQNTSILGLRTMNSCGRMCILDTIISIKVLLRREIVSITGVWWPWDCRDPVSVDMSVRGSDETQSNPESH